jgi:hypothetical protein
MKRKIHNVGLHNLYTSPTSNNARVVDCGVSRMLTKDWLDKTIKIQWLLGKWGV